MARVKLTKRNPDNVPQATPRQRDAAGHAYDEGPSEHVTHEAEFNEVQERKLLNTRYLLRSNEGFLDDDAQGETDFV